MDAIPTLSVDGFTTNKQLMMTKLFEYFKSSDYSQSNLFLGNVQSLKYIISIAKDSTELKELTEQALTNLYSSYYPKVAVDATIDETANNISVTADITCQDDLGNSYKLSQLVRVIDNNIVGYDNLEENLYV